MSDDGPSEHDQPFVLDSVNNISESQDQQEENLEIREDIGTPLDDEPELGENSTISGLNVGVSQDSRIINELDNEERDGADNQPRGQFTSEAISPGEQSWHEQTSRPHSSSAATPTQDDNISPEDISRIPVPTTGPQFLRFAQPRTAQGDHAEASDVIGSIPLPQVTDDGNDDEIAIVDAISNVNVIPGNVDEVSSDKGSDIRDISDHEVTEKDEFGRDLSRRRKGH